MSLRVLPPPAPEAVTPAVSSEDSSDDVVDFGAARAARDRARLDEQLVTVSVGELNRLGREHAAHAVAVAVAAERARLIALFRNLQLIVNQQGKPE